MSYFSCQPGFAPQSYAKQSQESSSVQKQLQSPAHPSAQLGEPARRRREEADSSRFATARTDRGTRGAARTRPPETDMRRSTGISPRLLGASGSMKASSSWASRALAVLAFIALFAGAAVAGTSHVPSEHPGWNEPRPEGPYRASRRGPRAHLSHRPYIPTGIPRERSLTRIPVPPTHPQTPPSRCSTPATPRRPA